MAVLHPVKVVIENLAADEGADGARTEQSRRWGPVSCISPRNLHRRGADFKEEANKQFKRLVLARKCLRNAYVIKAERVEKDADGKVTCIYSLLRPRDPGQDPADGRKVKG